MFIKRNSTLPREASAAELRDVLGALVAAQIKCCHERCNDYATIMEWDAANDPLYVCEAHSCAPHGPALKVAVPLRRALAMLAGTVTK